MIRGGSRAAATFKMEHFVIIVNGWKPFTIITKHSILDVAAALDSSLTINILREMKEFFVELNRLHYFRTQSIDWYYNGLDESTFFFLVLFLEKNAFDRVFCS